MRFTTSIGVASFPADGSTVEELLAHADIAMYQAKERGRNQYCVYTEGAHLPEVLQSRVTGVRLVREAIERDRFILFAQPIMDLRTNGIEQYEILLRIAAEDGRLIPPGAFLPEAERFNLINEIDRWVVANSIRFLGERVRLGARLRLSINLSAKALGDLDLLDRIKRHVSEEGVRPEDLVFEITETAAIADFSRAQEFVAHLKEFGCSFAVDDFGVGFSSFHQLRHLDVDYLKIDGSFVRHLQHDDVDQCLVRAMVQLARGLGKRTIAEFVEDGETLELLREYGVDCAQGYHIGRPGPVGDIPH